MSSDTSSRAGSWTPALIYLHDLLWAAAVMAATIAGRYQFETSPAPVELVVRATLVFTLICAVVFPLFRLQRGI